MKTGILLKKIMRNLRDYGVSVHSSLEAITEKHPSRAAPSRKAPPSSIPQRLSSVRDRSQLASPDR